MPLIRIHHRTQYTVIANATLADRRLSYRARGLLAYLLSKPDGWEATMTDLEQDVPEGREAIRRAFAELLATGYAVRRPARMANGQMCGQHTTIYEQPQPVHDAFPSSGKPTDRKTVARKPVSIVSNDLASNDLENTYFKRESYARARASVGPHVLLSSLSGENVFFSQMENWGQEHCPNVPVERELAKLALQATPYPSWNALEAACKQWLYRAQEYAERQQSRTHTPPIDYGQLLAHLVPAEEEVGV